MRNREKPQFIREWVRNTFPWIHGVLKCDRTPQLLGHWGETYLLVDFWNEEEEGHGVDYYHRLFMAVLNAHCDNLGFLQPYAPFRYTASRRKTLLVTGIHEECPYCILLQEDEAGRCRFMHAVFPWNDEQQRLFIQDLMSWLEACPVPLPLPHKGTLCPVTRRVTNI